MNVTAIPLSMIQDDMITNCRKNLDVSDLKESIQFSGLQTPVGVVQNEGGFGLIYGFRRLQAMRELGAENIEARVLEVTDPSILYMLNLQENVTRKSLSPIEEAEAIKRLIDLGKEPEDFGPALGWSKTLITQRLSLLEFSHLIQDALHEDTVSVRQAKLIEGAEDNHKEILLDLAKDGATLKVLSEEKEHLEALGRLQDQEDEEVLLYEDEVEKLPEPVDTSKEDAKSIKEANENMIKAGLLDCGAKAIQDDSAWFAYQVAVNCIDFKKLSPEQQEAFVTVVNILTSVRGLDAWGESHKR